MNGFNIGNVNIPNKFILGPMAGVTDLPFRNICKEMGSGLGCTEMISAKGIYYNNKNTELLWATNEEDSPLALQLFGSDPDIMRDMALRIEGMDFDIYDINMGCPVPKVVNNHEGSALMLDVELSKEIVKQMSSSLKKPVTVKFRKGFNKDNINAVKFGMAMEEAGASAICVHGRTREEYYRGKADWDIVKEVKENVNIPVVLSGDIFSAKDAICALSETKADAVMIARGARGNPWIFKECLILFEDLKNEGFISDLGVVSDASFYDNALLEKLCIKAHTEARNGMSDGEAIKNMIKKHAKMLVDFKGEYTGINEMRKHFAWYTGGVKGAATLRREVNKADTLEKIYELSDMIS
ncbi:MAG: tRNA-dihydrouridine synthase [Lachnospiraceae bacterium]|nr:tRNA-dihydrouridine synthase [Lachnospiraceae bacterium]